MALTAVHFGAGNIGRGFLGQLYVESGFETIFVETRADIVDALNERRTYPLRLVGESSVTLIIDNVRAIHAADVPAVAHAVAQARILGTSVGVGYLPSVAPLLAAGLEERLGAAEPRPVDVLMCENMIGSGPFMRAEVKKHLSPHLHSGLDHHVGFVEASIGRMVPVMTAEQRAEDPLLVCVEAFKDLPVDGEAFRAPLPPMENLQPRSNFAAYAERKAFIHNGTHAVAAYLGYLRGHELLWRAMDDSEVRTWVERAGREAAEALHRKHGLDLDGLLEHAADLAHRFTNRALGDTIVRIGADPVRKLGPNDRLIGALRLCHSQSVPSPAFARGAAAAMRFDPPGDPSSSRVQALLATGGPGAVLREIGHEDPNGPVGDAVSRAFAEIGG